MKNIRHHHNHTASSKVIAYREFMSRTMREIRAANPHAKQQDIMKMSAQKYRIHKGHLL